MATVIQIRRGDYDTWPKDYILRDGELGWEKPKKEVGPNGEILGGVLKIGDGETTWENLPSINTKAIINVQQRPTEERAIHESAIYRDTKNNKMYFYIDGTHGGFIEMADETDIGNVNDRIDEVLSDLSTIGSNLQGQISGLQGDVSSKYEEIKKDYPKQISLAVNALSNSIDEELDYIVNQMNAGFENEEISRQQADNEINSRHLNLVNTVADYKLQSDDNFEILTLKIDNNIERIDNLDKLIEEVENKIPPAVRYISIVNALPLIGDENKLYRVIGTQSFKFWNTDTMDWEEFGSKKYVNVVDELPKKGSADILYKVAKDQVIWHWNSKLEKMEAINANSELLTEVEELKKDLSDSLQDIKDIDEKIQGVNTTISNFDKEVEEQTNSINRSIAEINDKISQQTSIINSKIQEQNESIETQLSNQNTMINEQLITQNQLINDEIQVLKDYVKGSIDQTENFVDITATTLREEFNTLKNDALNTVEAIYIKDTKSQFPENGEDRKLYKAMDTQTIYYWDSKTSSYELLKAEAIELPEVKGGIEVIPETETLPSKGESDMLYKTLSNEKVWTWNESSNEFVEIGAGASGGTIVGGGIVVVEKFSDLPAEGKADVLYKVTADQLLYNFNTTTNAYEPLGQGGGTTDGYKLTLQSSIDRIFAVIKGEPAVISFRYSSVDKDGMNDGAGIGALYVNDVKKTNLAIPQKLQDLDITQYLSLGPNNVTLEVANSEKTATLTYSIELVDLYLTTNIKPMDIYDSETALPFQITGSGVKKLYYIMDGEEIATEEINSTNVYSHTFRVPMQTAGDHILKIHAEREINNMTVSSNILTFGMMFITEEMVDTFILSNFEQEKSSQGEIITIPYLVYNPFLETADVTLTIYNEDGSIYGTSKEITVDQTVQNWVTQDYPAGKITFEIKAHSDSGVDALKQFKIDIAPSTFDLSIIQDGLAMEFSAAGRSNAEANPEQWSYTNKELNETYTGSFERFAWSGADGWVESDAGETVLRLLPKNKFTIPFYPFKTDKKSTGYTIEMELETRDVANQESTILSCMSGNRGVEVKAQQVIFKSALSETSMYFKEDERVRITIVVEASTLDRVVYMFINGIICAAIQYAENDNFQQVNPVPITIGSDTCGIDLYKLRFYNRSFTFTEQLNNYMCDRSTNAERFAIKNRNDIYDISGNITIGSLPPEIPYLVIQCEELPQYKGDKKKEKSVYFVDQLNPDRCFTAPVVQLDVQGTSSAGYPIKNFKVKFSEDIVYNDGRTAEGYPIVNPDDLVSKCLCLKADYASSEQANNVMLVDFYDEVVRDYYLTPAQEKNPKVRTGISGRPIVVFWENTETGEIKFQGQYNMNNDKSNENVFGFDRDEYPELECWEFCNNTSDRCLFKKSEYEEQIYDEEKKEWNPAWMSDFEPRFPDLDDPYSDYTNYKRLTDWVVSTRQDQATNKLLEESVTYGDKTYLIDNAEYRLAKFKYEFEDYFIKDPIIFYYIFTEVFLMIDNRAKNMFLTSFDGRHWFPIPYDFDTAIGINNEGKLVFDYNLEDIDFVGGKPVYNGQESTLWINVRDAFTAEIYDMYDKLRTSGKFSYEIINEKMNKHQEECWPESIWNEDAKLKYVDVFLNTGVDYLEMCQGNKKTQREWWLYNTFKYRDSKYRTGDAQKIIATFRAYAPDDITVTPYQHLWPRVDYTDSYPVTKRSTKNTPTLLECPLDTANDTEMFIRSADRIASFGNLSKYMADTVNFAQAEKLQDITLGSHEPGYINTKLSSLTVGTNRLLTYLNVENCIALNKTIDLSNCLNLETIDAFGSSLPSVTLPVGGHLMNLNLPSTITNFEIKNQHMIEHFEMENYENIETLVIDDTPGLPVEDLLTQTPNLSCVRIVNTKWRVSSETVLKQIFNKLKTCIGKDANGKNVPNAVVTGYVEIDSISDDFLIELNDTFTELIVIVNGKTRFFLRYVDWNNNLLYRHPVSQGEDAIDPIQYNYIDTPVRDGGEDTSYAFRQWSDLPTNIQVPQTIVAMYDTTYRVQFLNGDDIIIDEQWIVKGQSAVDPIERVENPIEIPTKTSTDQYDFIFAEWDKQFDEVLSPMSIKALFSNFLRSYKVQFYNGDELLQETIELWGTCPVYNGDTSIIKKKIGDEISEYYEFAYWAPSLSEPIVGNTIYRTQFVFDGYIEDDWGTIAGNCALGKVDTYGYGGRKKMDITYSYNAIQYNEELELEIVDKEHDILERSSSSYANGSKKAGLTFKGVLKLQRTMNNSGKDYNGENTLNAGGWMLSDLRQWLNNDFIKFLPAQLQANLKSVEKKCDHGYSGPKDSLSTVYDKIFVPSLEELNLLRADMTTLGQGTPYILYTDDYSRKIDTEYWTRSTYKDGLHSFCQIPKIKDTDTTITTAGGGSNATIVFMFCI